MKIAASNLLAISLGILISCTLSHATWGFEPATSVYPTPSPSANFSSGCSNWGGGNPVRFGGGMGGPGMYGPGMGGGMYGPGMGGPGMGGPGMGGPGMCGPGMGGGGMGGYLNMGDTCSAAHWWDFFGEALFLNRELSGSNDFVFSSFGIRGVSPPNVALSANDLDSNWETGYRLGGRYQLSAISSIEAVYMDTGRFKDSASATSNSNDIYSFFSDFGNTPEGGFLETDQATQHSIYYESNLQSVEINHRRSWISHTMKTSGSWLWGFRYYKLDDRAKFNSIVLEHADPITMVPDRGPGTLTYDIRTNNDLYGVQIGGELSHTIFPGLLIVYEGKAGIYGNSSDQHSQIVATTLDPPTDERAGDSDVAYAGESQIYVLYQCHPLWKLRVGYQVLWMDQVALGIDNFNAQEPFTGLRDVAIDATSDVFYQGVTAGLEFGW